MIKIVRGESVRDLRQPDHPFGQELQKLRDSCDLVCSAPLAAILAGEHAAIDGAFMVVAPLPLRVYVGVIGRNKREDGIAAEVSCFRYYDPCTDALVDRTYNPASANENIRNLPQLLNEMAKSAKERKVSFPYVPSEIVILSESPPGRTGNWSGAFADALALVMYLLQGGKKVPEQLLLDVATDTTQVVHRDEAVELLFRLALQIESASHGLASGYGPACSLLPAHGQLFLFKGFVNERFATTRGDSRRNSGFFLAHWDAYLHRLPASHYLRLDDVYDLMFLDSGIPISTVRSIERIQSNEENAIAQDLHSLLLDDPNHLAPLLVNSSELLDLTLQRHRVAYVTLGVLSVLVAKTLRDCLCGLVDASTVLQLVQSIDAIHRWLNLSSFDQMNDLRGYLSEDLAYHRAGVKITGAGEGGAIVVWGLRKTIEAIQVNERMSDEQSPTSPTLVWQLSRDGLAQEGVSLHSSKYALPLGTRSTAKPYARPARQHIAHVLIPEGQRGCVMYEFPPASLYDMDSKLQKFTRNGTCLYLYFHDDSTIDSHEPVFLTWPSAAKLHVREIAPSQGKVLLKDCLLACIRSGAVEITIPNEQVDFSNLLANLSDAQDALNFAGNRLSNELAASDGRFAFPRMSRKRLPSDKVYLRFTLTLQLPRTSSLIVISPLGVL